ncbi:unnamed protein product [Cylicocyclus nassatus]|uniref:Uncharacterized protein n=1 Tax=Cylicocyclus nassatus TaxID=53992 RepID=A0AA36M446_CYLNA|nr:unnamed protein product [Cylicocyclus nassatus]
MKAMWHLVAIPLLTFFIPASEGKPCKPDRLDKRLAKAFHNRETEWWFCCDCKRESRSYSRGPIVTPIPPKGIYAFASYRRGTTAAEIVADLINKVNILNKRIIDIIEGSF